MQRVVIELWYRLGMTQLIIQWIADTTEFFKELGPLVSELTGLLTTVGICVTVALGIVNRRSIQAGTRQSATNTQKLDAVHEQGNATLHNTAVLAMRAGVAEGNLEGRAQQTKEREAANGTRLDTIPNRPKK
jgi:hypothetical protein